GLTYYAVMSFVMMLYLSSRRRHTRFSRDWSSDVCSSDLRREFGLARGEEDVAAPVEFVLRHHPSRPFVVVSVAEDELDLVVGGQQPDVLPAVARGFARARGLDIQHPRHPRVHRGNVDRAGGFQGHRVSGVAQPL